MMFLSYSKVPHQTERRRNATCCFFEGSRPPSLSHRPRLAIFILELIQSQPMQASLENQPRQLEIMLQIINIKLLLHKVSENT